MKLTEFIKMQDKARVENATISFKLLLPPESGGTRFFFCENGRTVDDLCEWIETCGFDNELEFPFNDVTVESDKAPDGETVCKYVFDFNGQ